MSLRRFEKRNVLLTVVAAIAMILAFSSGVLAQSLTTGAIIGTVTDPTGAVVPSAQVTVTNIDTGAKRTMTTGASGTYTASQLEPGQYRVSITASGFRVSEIGPITVAVSRTANADVTLEVGAQTQTVEVTGAAQVIETSNPNNTATIGKMAIENLPNPGFDLTYVAQVAPGAVMNTSGGYGNVEFNGLPAESTNFTIDGIDANDPYLNLNNSGATNLQLGLNSIEETSVNTLSFSVDQGRQGAAQVNFVSKSGGNGFHGNLYEVWNGSRMNAANFFLNALPGTNPKPFSNLNQFGGSVGGPIRKNKLFFFFDWEETRIVLPISATDVITPTPAFQQYTLNQLPKGGYDPLQGVSFAPPPNPAAAVSYYNQVFSLYGNKTGSPVQIPGCPIAADGTITQYVPGSAEVDGTGCAVRTGFGIGNFTKDRLWDIRVDQHVGDSNTLWYKFSRENGIQATGSDPINPAFSASSPQPQVNGAMGWSHTFGPTVVNEFNPGFFWYSAIFSVTNLPKALSLSPLELDGPFTSIFGGASGYPQGRKVTNWQLIDNLTWTRNAHTFKFGENFRRTLISDHGTGAGVIPVIAPAEIVEWSLGVADFATQSFPLNGDEPVGVTNLDLYAGDSWKVKSNLTFTYGIRATWNSNLISQHSDYSRLTGDFYSISHDVNQPLNQVVKTHLSQLLPGTQTIVWQPRAAIAWEVRPRTVIRVGGGKFSDVFPYVLGLDGLRNFPNVNSFAGGVSGNVASTYVVPGSGDGVSGSFNNDVVTAMQQANQAVVSGFANGALSCYSPNAGTPCLSRNGFRAFPSNFMPYPYFLEWTAGVEHQFGSTTSLKVQYVGTKATQLAYNFRPNARELYCDGCFTPYTRHRLDNRFGTVNQWTSGANSNYEALQTTVQKRFSHGLQFALNYSWSHCLDTISNGGRFPFNFDTTFTHPHPGERGRDYGNCDFDVRHTLNASYVYQLPNPAHGRLLGQMVNGWQVSGDVFLHSGFPFTAISSGGVHFSGVNGPQFATANPGVPIYSKNVPIPGVTVTPGEVQWLNPNAFTSVTNPDTGDCVGGNTPANCQFGNAGRNTLVAPGFHWADFIVTKRFKIRENVAFRIEAQFFNVFNHPNLFYPDYHYGVPGIADTLVDRGTITSTTSPFTGLLGSGLGGDTSVRMIALSGRFEF